MPLLDFDFLALIRKQQLVGVYGYLIEFVDIDPNVSFAYEIAGLNKLCTLLVEDENVCSRVISLNRQAKGRQINILPLSFVRQMALEKKNYPKEQDCFSLLNPDWLTVRGHLYGQ